MKKWLASIALVVLAFGSTGLAVHDDGGGGGGVYAKRTPDELRQLLQEYRARRAALRQAAAEQAPSLASTAPKIVLTEEQEMLQLQQLAYEAQLALRQAKRLTNR